MGLVESDYIYGWKEEGISVTLRAAFSGPVHRARIGGYTRLWYTYVQSNTMVISNTFASAPSSYLGYDWLPTNHNN